MVEPQSAADASVPVDRAELDRGRRKLVGRQVSGTELAALPVCAAPAAVLVRTAEGAWQACEATAMPLAPAGASLNEAWNQPLRARVAAELAAGRLPLPHCAGCAQACAAGLIETAPLLRAYGTLRPGAADRMPAVLVLRLPPDAVPATLLEELVPLLPLLDRLVLEGDAVPHGPAARAVLECVRAAAVRPGLELRTRQCGDPVAAAALLAGCTVPVVRLRLLDGAAQALPGALALARALGASLRAELLLTPEHWFELEPVAQACAQHEVPLDLLLAEHGGEPPLLAVGLADLQFVHGVLGSWWRRLSGDARPRSLAADAFDQLRAGLRECARRRGSDALQSATAARAAYQGRPLLLPPLEHPLWRDDALRAELLPRVLGDAHLPCVQAWLATQIAARDAVRLFRQRPWLRVLLQRTACDHRSDAALDLLRALYGEARGRAQLLAEDRAFAAQVPLANYGGPWAARLGIEDVRKRAVPFKLPKKPVPPASDAAPRITVLIPSFRHEQYITETIHSVLAQRGLAFRVLVVDDASPDATAARARAIADPRVTVRVNARNQGLGNTVLEALAAIDTPLVALLNSDDLFHPERLARCVAALDGDPAVQLVTTGMKLIDAQGGELSPDTVSLVLDGKKVFDWVHWYHRVQPTAGLDPVAMFRALLEHNFLATSSNLVARTDWLRRQQEPLQSLKYCLDWQLFLQAALEGAHVHLPEPLVGYRLHATNTVWFREGRRWSYFLEVNRVAAQALRQFFARHGRDASRDADVAGVLEAVVAHVAQNREADGFALYLNEVLEGLQLDRAAERSPRVQALVERLNDVAQHTRVGRDVEDRLGVDPWRALSDLEQVPGLRVRQTLCDLAQEEAAQERDARRWLANYVEDVEQRLRECWVGRDALEHDKAALLEKEHLLDRWIRDFTDQVHHLTEDQSRLLKSETGLKTQLVAEQDALRAARAELETVQLARRGVEAELARLQGVAARVEADLEAARQALAAERNELAASRGELAATRAENASLRQDGQTLRDEGTRLRQELDRRHDEARQLRDQAHGLTGERDQLLAQRGQLEQDLTQARTELQQLRGSREFRAGNLLWNKLPLGYAARRGKKWLRRSMDLKDRTALLLRRLFRRSPSAPATAVVAACWQFPIYSHTFVYQEMLGLTHMGMDVKLFCWEHGDTSQLHAAFKALDQHRTQLQPVWESHLRDRDHFQNTAPGRLEAFLELVSKRVGKSVAELLQEPLVLQGCTFARMAEMAGAKYLHTYFFYDQSFMAMLAAWLLRIPRGVSCYADHMLEDYPFKLVALHVETADVIVATSKRIKRELSQLSGGRFDDKILVKPNGVDGKRFPFVARGARGADQPFEVVSISRIEPKKGLIHLVEAVAALKRAGRKVVVHVVGTKDPHSKGSVEYAAQFEQRIAALDVGAEFVLQGFKKQEELQPILQRCRAFVAPYVEVSSGDKDGIPTSMLEAMASGLPVVTTDSGSILEVVDDGVEGFVCKQGDAPALAQALERLIADPALEQKLARAARARFDKEFDAAVTEKRLHERVRALLKQYAKAPAKG